ncbi:MAG TPA: DUF4423 domain-containing protein [Bdellovibrionota bacterium]|nr:DUF4423 domain-containing protein [Bdellovibrionota bacterium]
METGMARKAAPLQSVFAYEDYKAFLHAKIANSSGLPGYKTQLARAMGRPQSFLSQVLHSHVHLTWDHGLRLAQFWNLTADERDYFLDLIQLSRAATPELRKFLERRLAELRKRNETLARRFDLPALETTEAQWAYYTAWHFGAIHMLLTIPEFRTVATISKRFHLPQETVEGALASLEKMGLCERKGEKWLPTQSNLYIDRQSPASPVNHMIWRQRAIEDIFRSPGKGLHNTVLHTLSRADLEQVRAMMLDLIERTRQVVVPSKEEALVCINMDLFEV